MQSGLPRCPHRQPTLEWLAGCTACSDCAPLGRTSVKTPMASAQQPMLCVAPPGPPPGPSEGGGDCGRIPRRLPMEKALLPPSAAFLRRSSRGDGARAASPRRMPRPISPCGALGSFGNVRAPRLHDLPPDAPAAGQAPGTDTFVYHSFGGKSSAAKALARGWLGTPPARLASCTDPADPRAPVPEEPIAPDAVSVYSIPFGGVVPSCTRAGAGTGCCSRWTRF